MSSRKVRLQPGMSITESLRQLDAHLGGARSGGKSGRGSEKYVPSVAPRPLDQTGGPTHLAQPSIVSSFTVQTPFPMGLGVRTLTMRP